MTDLRNLMCVACRVVFGTEPCQLSLLYFLYVCACAGGFNKVLDTEEGCAQEWIVKVRCLLTRFTNSVYNNKRVL